MLAALSPSVRSIRPQYASIALVLEILCRSSTPVQVINTHPGIECSVAESRLILELAH